MVAVRHPSGLPRHTSPRAVRILDGSTAHVIALSPGKTFVLGRSDRAEVVFRQDRVSRLHGMLWYQDGHWRYRDLGSANGSFVYEAMDYARHEDFGEDLPVEALREGQGRPLAVGEGVLLGTRKARLELLSDVPADAWAEGDPMLAPRGQIDDAPTAMFALEETQAPHSLLDSLEDVRDKKA